MIHTVDRLNTSPPKSGCLMAFPDIKFPDTIPEITQTKAGEPVCVLFYASGAQTITKIAGAKVKKQRILIRPRAKAGPGKTLKEGGDAEKKQIFRHEKTQPSIDMKNKNVLYKNKKSQEVGRNHETKHAAGKGTGRADLKKHFR